MQAYFGGSGLVVRLFQEDKKKGEETGELECQLHQWKKPKLFLHIVDKPEKGFMEEPGFHIEVIPPGTSPEHRTQYDLYLSKERFAELTNPEDPVVKGGYFATRSKYDRIDMTYWEV